MAPTITPVQTSSDVPASTTVVVIGGGIIGLTAALALAERNIPVVVLEKGRIAGEQSSRNLGWIRKTSRHRDDVPLAQAADRLWAGMAERVGGDVGYRQSGIMFLARSEEQLAMHEAWLASVESLSLDSRMLDARDIDRRVPGGKGEWVGGIFTASDGRAEPSLAASAIARAAMARGATIVENCAVRTVSRSGGKVSGVVTESGEIRCDQVLLAGGLWSRRFLGNLGVSLPTLPLISSVLRTAPMEGPTDIAVGGPDFSFRKHKDGGYIVTQRGALDAPLMLDHLLIGSRYLGSLRSQRHLLRISLGKHFLRDLTLPRRWGAKRSPFERIRTMDPPVNPRLNDEALRNLAAAWPVFERASVAEAWAGMIDITPDSNPVIGAVPGIPGLSIASGFSGHGFGTSPAAGQLAADLLAGEAPIIDPAPYRFARF
ncbi:MULTISPECIES: FAD-binding oxidoreductase [Modicisalibacter]|uniref:NAD(P)/FAD-dependent oxidoreductase n=2 Tax=Halomonadaceae TaxID=28256 RepID=UPI00100B5C4C|nr:MULTISPECIES: FAD-binding oxidoreductase [Halomonadaceae]MBZ9557487.1 FAD-binding oxidoreductase [Modicisalibacter sp. R2A 31.J]MBZ9573847.1 FAD-binding oxidoreductase [Modicisalibacter sp. MOD 31.J]